MGRLVGVASCVGGVPGGGWRGVGGACGAHRQALATAAFAWQEGYAVFSVSKSIEPAVKECIEHQAQHHRKHDFKDELLALLNVHGVEFDGRYVFD